MEDLVITLNIPCESVLCHVRCIMLKNTNEFMTLPKSSKDFSQSESSIVVLKMIIYNDCMNGFLL